MRQIHTREQFQEFGREIGMRHDWHEPDERDITARVEGMSFDNAGTWPTQLGLPEIATELHVIFSRSEVKAGVRIPTEDLAAVNLATLCAWAAGTLTD